MPQGRRRFHQAGLLALGALLLLGGCDTLGYYAQSARGQLELLAARRPFAEVEQDPGTPPGLRDRLAYVRAARAFAVRELGLPDSGSFRSYADIGRRYVAWSVMATPELALTPRTWCFPVAGCVAYRGYFDEAEAARFAAGLRARGDDVYVAGIPAYSTLGWLADPLPSSVVNWPEAELAGIIFHELAHQRLYVRDDTPFNEAFAVTVEQEGVRRWLAVRGDDAGLARWEQTRREQQGFLQLVFEVRDRLAGLYSGALPVEEVRSRKADLFKEFLSRCHALSAASPDESRARSWCGPPANNARLMAVATYHELVPALRALLAAHRGDLVAFYRTVESLAGCRAGERRQALAEAARAAGPGLGEPGPGSLSPSPGPPAGDLAPLPDAGGGPDNPVRPVVEARCGRSSPAPTDRSGDPA